jgi:hypothetical protein
MAKTIVTDRSNPQTQVPPGGSAAALMSDATIPVTTRTDSATTFGLTDASIVGLTAALTRFADQAAAGPPQVGRDLSEIELRAVAEFKRIRAELRTNFETNFEL